MPKQTGKVPVDTGAVVEVMLTLDTTGSMFGVASEVQENIDLLVARLFKVVPGLRMGLIVHGDYCDRRSSYVSKLLPLTDDSTAIVRFIKAVGRTGGGDAPECYELVLRELNGRDVLWTPGARKVVVMIGDEEPHTTADQRRQGQDPIDYRIEARLLSGAGVAVYTVQCRDQSHADYFYEEVSQLTGGLHLRLAQFSHVEQLILGVASQLQGADALQAYEQEVRRQGPMGHSLENMFDKLAGRKARVRKARVDRLDPVTPSRFQIFQVGRPTPIKEFVEARGMKFEKGRGFYLHNVRTEAIQDYKEIVLVDRVSGEMFTGIQAQRMIGLVPGSTVKVPPCPLGDKYDVWVQSTSLNRILARKGKEPFMYDTRGLS